MTAAPRRRIGIVGGTFDPPHYAHLILGEHAHEELDLEKVLYVPAGTPPHKDSARTPAEHRVAMLQMAIGDNPLFELSRVDVDRPGPHYSIDMVRLLRSQYPDTDFFFIMGEDMFNDLPNWKRAEGLFNGEVTVAVMQRLGQYGVLTPDKHEAVLPGLHNHVVMLSSPLVEISSTDIVARLRQGRSPRYLLPDVVLAYIYRHGLYAGSAGS